MSTDLLLKVLMAAPLLSSTVLLLWRGAPRAAVTTLGVGSVAASAVLTAVLALGFDGGVLRVVLWQWMSVGGLDVAVAARLDGLSLTMTAVVTGVGALIHLFAAGYMAGDPGYRRFFAYMNLFVAAMLLLVLADDLLALFFGWEGVGLCSYLLIGFWYRDPANGQAARKAFVVTRIGDVALLIAMLVLFTELGTLRIDEALARATQAWPAGSAIATAVALLLLGGAVGKSAQLPLHVWLPDAMAGPTPVSALIHAATMVTAGVYLIARTHPLFELAPAAMSAVGWVGAAGLLLAAGAALGQRDIKRVLAYSTMSQIAYMFLALGAGAWQAAIFHLVTHAFFKALLFLSAGYVIVALHHEQDIFRMGDLRRRLPLAWWCFLVGGGALAALPWVTAGFWSKDLILWQTWLAGAHDWWLLGMAGAALTSVYTFRMIFIAFCGPPRSEVHEDRSLKMRLPLLVLAALSLFGGLLDLPLEGVLPAGPEGGSHAAELMMQMLAAVISVGGVAYAWRRWGQGADGPAGTPLAAAAAAGWGFDALYAALFVTPYRLAARLLAPDPVDRGFDGLVALVRAGHHGAIALQTGRLRHYLLAFALGVLLLAGGIAWR